MADARRSPKGDTFSGANPRQPYRIQSSPSLAAGSWTDFTNVTYTGPILINDTSSILTTFTIFACFSRLNRKHQGYRYWCSVMMATLFGNMHRARRLSKKYLR